MNREFSRVIFDLRNSGRYSRCVYLLLSCLFFTACDQNGRATDDSRRVESLPLALKQLRSLSTGTLSFSVSVNDIAIVNNNLIAGERTELSVNSAQFVEGANKIDVAFMFTSENIASRQIAFGSQILNYSPTQTEIAFSGLSYSYVDSDVDGIYDVSELAIQEIDVDNDGVFNVDDSDSDNDGVLDGADSTPWGDGTASQIGALSAELVVELPDGTIRTLMIDQVNGGSGEVIDLDNNNVPLPFIFPDNWPGATVPNETITARWSAFELQVDGNGLCDHLRLPLDISSLVYSGESPVLLYFKRFNGPAYITALNSGGIDDLDVFEHPEPFDGDGPFNDALRVILVPYHTVGWLELWTNASLTGQLCSLNLSAPGSL